MVPRKNLNFLNVRHSGFWHSGRLFALLQMPSVENLKEFFSCPPPLKSRQPPHPPHLIKKMNGPLVAVSHSFTRPAAMPTY